ncbi:MAG: helix-turn-helix domain-containing protein [Lachnospirales bacterium]
MAFTQMNLEERRFVEKNYNDGMRIAEIASSLRKSANTIYNELHRGATEEIKEDGKKVYSAEVGQKRYMQKKRNCGQKSKRNIKRKPYNVEEEWKS